MTSAPQTQATEHAGGCTHDCDQGHLCTCDIDHGALWIRIPDAIAVLFVVLTLGIILGVQLVRMGMAV